GRLLDGLRQHPVARRVLGDPQRLEDRNAVVQQSTEDAGEARQRETLVNAAHLRDPQAYLVDDQAAAFRAAVAAHRHHQSDENQYQQPAPTLQEMAGGHQGAGQERQVALVLELLEDRLELGHEEDDQRVEDDEAGGTQEDGVRQGADHLGLEVFLLLGEAGDAGQHVFEEAAFLAGVDHADGQLGEGLGVLGYGVGEAGAVGDLGFDFLDDAP